MESGVLDKGDMQKMQGRGDSRTGLGSTALDLCYHEKKLGHFSGLKKKKEQH